MVNWAETNLSFQNTDKSTESGSVVHHQPSTINTIGANPVLYAIGENEACGLNGRAFLLSESNTEIA